MVKSGAVEDLEKVSREIETCQRCPLYKAATRSVPGAGNSEAKLIFVGEAPGFHEDQQGLPFVGAAGKLLDKLLVKIGLKREDVWIGNTLKHRPPGNRDPLPEELEACRPYLDRQIKAINPEVIVTLGRFALNYFLPEEKITQAHGVARYAFFAEKKRIMIPVYHPAAALRNGSMMIALEKDFEKIAQFLARAEPPVQSEPPSSLPTDQQLDLF